MASEGRIEQTLLDGDAAPTDLRPSPAKRTIPQKVPNVSIYDKRDGIPIRIPAWLAPESGRDGGGAPTGLWTADSNILAIRRR